MTESWTYRLIFCRLVAQMAHEQGMKTLGELMDELARDATLAVDCVDSHPREARKGGVYQEGGPAVGVMAALREADITDPTLGIAGDGGVISLLTIAIQKSRPQPVEGGVECA